VGFKNYLFESAPEGERRTSLFYYLDLVKWIRWNQIPGLKKCSNYFKIILKN